MNRRLDISFDADSGGPATRGARDLGGPIPPGATRLTLRFEPAEGWQPQEPWQGEIELDLRNRRLIRR